ncbi:MAG: TolC family protein [Ignavibacteria bacterium]
MNRIILITGFLIFALNINAQKYDLNSFIELVKQNNKDILIAAEEVKLAQTQEKEAKSSAFPQLNIEAGYSRNLKEGYMYADLSALGGGEGGPAKFKVTYDNEFDLKTILSQQIFNASVFNAIKASKQYENLSGYVYDATFQGVIAGSKKAFHQTLLLKKVWEVNKSAQENAEENYNDVKMKYDEGLVSQFELLQAEVRWKNLIPSTTQAKRNYNLALNSLKILAGLSIEDDFQIEGDLENYSKNEGVYELETALENRPDYQALVSEKELRKINVSYENSAYMPSLSASLVYNYNSVSNEFKFENENNYLIAGLTLHVPVFNGWNTSAKVERAEIELMQSELKIQQAKEEINKELKNISLRIAEAKNRITSAESTINAAKKAFEIAEVSTKNGLATQLELKDARVNFDQAKLNFYSAVYDYLESYFDWELAVGIIN